MNDKTHELPGPILLLAGPGTGKTTRLAKRIKYLVEDQNVSPQNIVVITFTTAAAKNMRDKISDITKPDLYLTSKNQPQLIKTMHSLGYMILKENPSAFGLEDTISVVTTDKLRNILIGDAAQIAGYDRADSIDTINCRQYGNCVSSDEKKCHICEAYKSILRCCSAIDYDEQIFLACKLLKDDSSILEKYQSKCMHLLVDEYQDINAAQFELISLLSKGQEEGLFVVGDDDQSIYSWRGGSPEFIRSFKKDFGKNSKIVSLNKSFRCHKNILEGSLAIVKNFDKLRLPKEEFEYEHEEGPKIVIHNAPSDEKEATIVKSIIEKALPSLDVLILFPHQGFKSLVIQELRNAKIAYSAPLQLPGEGLPLISVLSKWLRNNHDSLAFREILERFTDNPAVDIPSKRVRKEDKKRDRKKAFKKISLLWENVIDKRSPSVWAGLIKDKKKDSLYSKVYTEFSNLISLFDNEEEPDNFIAQIVETFILWKKTPDFIEEIENWIEASEQLSILGQSSDVRLMSLQGAKGLEANVVCVIGLEDGILPRSDSKDKDLSEQSRLMFVSMTRAINELHLFHARKRSGDRIFRSPYKKDGKPDLSRSRFLDYIPDKYKEGRYHKPKK